MCPNKDLRPDEKGVMSIELFRKVLDEVHGHVHDIYLHHRGEPLMNPAIYDMVRYAASKGVRTRFHSNATLLDDDRARKILETPLDLISFSIDGFEREAYERVRIGADFDTTLKNVFRFLELRRAAGSRKPYVVIEKINFHDGEHELLDHPEAIALKKRFVDAGADEVIEKDEYAWALETKKPVSACDSYARCTFPWYAAVISWDGTVTPCPQDFHCVLNMGNVASRTLAEIWNGPAYRDLRRRLKSDVSSLSLCRNCDRIRRKTVGGLPLQYMMTFLVDHLAGYGRVRRVLGTAERN
jgi:radical SAM protein with 4Fe4S-binding SPASM domain